ncbi:MAG TPA: S8 family serine peptidase, partial [bacterium]|nr:S8 family serine peptidase [bacterium]
MRRNSICFKLHLVIAGIFIALNVHGAETAADGVNKHVVPGEFFVRFAPGSALAAANELEKAGSHFKKSIDIIGAELWTFPIEKNISEVLKEVKAIRGVVAVEPVYMCYLHDDYPNDGKDQWALTNMDVVQSWQFVQDSDAIVVAMIDTGIVPSHPDLQGRIAAGRDFVGAEPDPPNHHPDDNPTDYYGHGTMTSGIIGAIINNNTGIAGAVPNVLIMPLKVSADSAGGSLEPDVLPDAMQWAIDNGASVVNASYGSPYHQHLVREVIQKMQDAGILFVASAGNDGTDNDDPDFSQAPCSFNLANIVGVMATDANDLQASFSSYGSKAVDLGAPGRNIKTTYLLSSSGYATRN